MKPLQAPITLPADQRNHTRPQRVLVVLLFFVILILAGGGYWFYRQQQELVHGAYYDDLQSIARLKTRQILAWRQERLTDARMNSSGMIRSLTIQWLHTAQPEILKKIKERLQFFLENEGYHNIILADVSGRIHTSLVPKSSELEPMEARLLKQVVSTGQPILGDFYYCQNCRRIHINVAAPILDDHRRVTAALLLIADPERDLYPLMLSWPTAHSEDAETVLVRREGDNVLYLNRVRYQPGQALQFQIALTQKTLPAVQAILGKTGIFHGTDYHGKEVIAHLNPVPDTSWFMVTKRESRRMLAESRFRGAGILLLVLMGAIMAGILARLIYISRKNVLSEALLLAEHERRQTEKEIRATLYGISAGVIATDARTLVTRMNPEAEKLTGWKEKEALGQPLATIFQIFDEETEIPLELPIHRVLHDGEIVGVGNQVILIARDDRRWPVSASWSPIRDEGNEITGAVLVFRDQTMRQAMEKERAESNKRYSDLIESLNDFIWETGPDGRYSFASRRCIDLLGYTPEEFVGKTWLDILNKKDEPIEKIEKFKKSLASRQPYTQLCRTFLRKDGLPVVLESSATPTFDLEGRFLGYRGISRDVTERRKAEEEQKSLQEQLLHAQKMDTVGRLAGGVAHDFNNMLTVICTYVEMALDELGYNHSLYNKLFEVHQAALHSAELTRQLLAFARKQVISPKVLNLNETLTDSLKMLRRLIGENIELIWKPGPDLWQVQIDPTQIGQILANLAVNARDAIGDVGELIIETGNIVIDQAYCVSHADFAPGNYVLLTFTDDGCGMERDTLFKIFEPFFTTKKDGKGTGLGLSTVYGIVKQNKGIINVRSKPGKGTTFRIYLPQKKKVPFEKTPRCNRESKNQGSETILLVEDEIAILQLGTFVLEQQGYTVLPAQKPSEALTIALQHEGVINLLITDMIMPEMNGRELAGKLLTTRPEIKILLMSGYTADIIDQHTIENFNAHFLEKPFSGGKLGEKVRAVLDQR